MVLHGRIRTGSDWRFSKNVRIRTGSDSIFADQDCTRTEKFPSPLISVAQSEFPLDQVHRTIGTGFYFSWYRFLFFVVPVFIYFLKKFPNFCGQICGLGLIRARFTKFLLSVVQPRDEHWTGFGLDWIRTMTNFVDFELDPDCKMLHKFRTRIGFGLSYWKRIM